MNIDSEADNTIYFR